MRNRLKDLPPHARVDQAWAADIIYVGRLGGRAYLTAVMDLCSRNIVGWALAFLVVTLVNVVLRQAIAAPILPPDCLTICRSGDYLPRTK